MRSNYPCQIRCYRSQGSICSCTEGLWETNSFWLWGLILSEEMFKMPLGIQVENLRYSGLGKPSHLVASPTVNLGTSLYSSSFVFSKNKLGNGKISEACLGRNAVTMTTIFLRLVSFEHFAREGLCLWKACSALSLPRSLHKEHLTQRTSDFQRASWSLPLKEASVSNCAHFSLCLLIWEHCL